jgi:hypothetical protein
LPPKVLEELDKYAESMHMDRSHFLEWLLENAFALMPNFVEVFKVSLNAQKKLKTKAK